MRCGNGEWCASLPFSPSNPRDADLTHPFIAECYYSDWHKTLVGKVKARDHPNNGETCQISKAWITGSLSFAPHSSTQSLTTFETTDWLKNPPKMHSTVTGTDPSPASHPFIDDVLCEHGGLAADVKKRKMISLEVSRSLFDHCATLS